MAAVAALPKIICRVKALYAFSSSETSSLSFEKDEFIDVLTQLDSGWWDGWCNGKRGWFPSNYVQLVDFNTNNNNNNTQQQQQQQQQQIYDSMTNNMNNNNNNTNLPSFRNEEDDANLPEGWKLQIAEDGHTKYYFNEHTGGLRWNHPGISDSDEEREDSNTEEDEPEKDQPILNINDFDFGHSLTNSKEEEYANFPLPPPTEHNNINHILMSNWIKKTTPQGKVYYGNYITHETTWDFNEIDPSTGHLKKNLSIPEVTNHNSKDSDTTSQERSDSFSLTSSAASSILMNEEDVPMTWKSISIEVAQSIHNLNRAVNRGEHVYLFKQRVAAVVDSVRMMLYSSRSLDKDAPHLQDIEVKEPHRFVLSTLAKLILTAKIASDTNADVHDRIQRDASELLNSVRKFVLICQAKDIEIEPVNPRLILSNIDITTTSEDGSHKTRRSSNSTQHSTNSKSKYFLNQDLIVSLQTHAKQIINSADTLCKASSYIYTLEEEGQQEQQEKKSDQQAVALDQNARSNVVVLFQNLSSQIGIYLSILGDIDTSHIEQAQNQSLTEFLGNKQQLFNSVGSLFNAVQTITNPKNSLMNSIASIENVIHKIEASLENIFQNIVQLVSERKTWLMRNDSTLIEEVAGQPSPTSSSFDSELSKKRYNSISDSDTVDPILTRIYSRQNSQQQGMPHQHQRKSSLSRPTMDGYALKRQFSHNSGSQEDQANLWFLGYDYAEGDLILTADKGIKGGTLRALVERLTLHDSIDMSFIANFLLTYRSFCTTEEFVDLLQERYNLVPPEELTPAELIVWTDKKQKLIRLRVFNIMKNWLENYYNDEDEFILNKLQLFANTVIHDASSFSADQLTRLIRKRRDLDTTEGGLKKLIPTTVAGPSPILQKNLKAVRLLETDTLELARQLTLMDFKHYSSIRPIECLSKAWSKDGPNVAPNVKQSIDYCNRLTSWVTGCILAHTDPKKRVIAIKYWAQVASRCVDMNNYNTCMAILSAFDNSAVGRLKRTWDLVSNRTLQTLSQIRKLMGSNRNFNDYREMIHSVNPPCIPFLGIYLQDLTFIEDGNPDLLKQSTNLINFAKQQKSAEVIREIKQFQTPPYIFQTVPEIQDFVKYQLEASRDVDYLYERSLTLEPRVVHTD